MIRTTLVIATIFLYCSCSSEERQRQIKKQEFPVVHLSAKDTFIYKSYVASIEAIRNVELRNRVSGYLKKINVDEGQQVRQGQVLFVIDDEEYAAEVSKAQAQLTNAMAEAKSAEVQLGRVKLLVGKDIISPTELELARANLNAQVAMINEARSTLGNAKTRLAYTLVKSPFSGIINRIPFKEGSLLAEGSLLTTVSDINSIYAYFNIAEEEYLGYLRDKIVSGNNGITSVRMILADGTSYRHEGKIETTSSEFQQGTGSIAFRAKFPNPEKMLRHGATGEVVLATLMKDAVFLPQKSVFEIQDRNYVFVVDDSNRVKMRSFVPETRVDNYYIVKSGLQSGDRVVYEGVQKLKDGMNIIPTEVDLPMLSNLH